MHAHNDRVFYFKRSLTLLNVNIFNVSLTNITAIIANIYSKNKFIKRINKKNNIYIVGAHRSNKLLNET